MEEREDREGDKATRISCNKAISVTKNPASTKHQNWGEKKNLRCIRQPELRKQITQDCQGILGCLISEDVTLTSLYRTRGSSEVHQWWMKCTVLIESYSSQSISSVLQASEGLWAITLHSITLIEGRTWHWPFRVWPVWCLWKLAHREYCILLRLQFSRLSADDAEVCIYHEEKDELRGSWCEISGCRSYQIN